jgi:hypothetical protein
VQTALRAMASIGADGVTVTGGPLPATPVDLEFVGVNAAQAVATISTTDTLTGGSTATSSLVTGAVPDTTIAMNANVPLDWDVQGYFANPFGADVATLRASNASGVDTVLKVRTLSNA